MHVPVCRRHKRGGGTSPPPAPQPGLLRPVGELSPREFGGVRAAPLSARLGHYTAVRDRGAPASRRTCYRLCGCESSFLRCLPAGCPRCCVCRLLSGSGLLPLPSAPPAGRRRLRSCARARVSLMSASAQPWPPCRLRIESGFPVSLLSAAGPWEALSPSPGAGSGCVARADSGLWG